MTLSLNQETILWIQEVYCCRFELNHIHFHLILTTLFFLFLQPLFFQGYLSACISVHFISIWYDYISNL